ncbi:hypothetical protein SDJN03_15325, partial [Cucurbita argyrosperma subsp. sororia]
MCYPHDVPPRREFLNVQCNWVLLQTAATAVESGGGESVKKRCLCSPTRHPGSFRCRLHRSEYVWVGRPRMVKSGPAASKKVALFNDE